MKFEVKVDSALNSGVQIRSQSVGDTPEGRVNGPQVEISLDGMAGYVYGEAAGGWMATLLSLIVALACLALLGFVVARPFLAW